MKHDKLISKIVTWTVGITLFFSVVNLLRGLPFMAIVDSHWKEHLVAAAVFLIPTVLVIIYGIIVAIHCHYKTKQQAIENVKKRRGDGKYTKLEVEKELKSMRRRRDAIERQAVANVIERLGTDRVTHDEVMKEIAKLEQQASNDSSNSSSSNN